MTVLCDILCMSHLETRGVGDTSWYFPTPCVSSPCLVLS